MSYCADYGDHYAAARLPDLLAEQGMLDLLDREVAAGTRGAARALRRTHISSAGS
ncbi:hypothetical protein [Amycolatopsis sp. lyj-108]|uniref:hypothetical protein n=1 Tax=Amycolatopsis sp. lyj-108 TaxID=2789286 RepID=UPI00397C1B37